MNASVDSAHPARTALSDNRHSFHKAIQEFPTVIFNTLPFPILVLFFNGSAFVISRILTLAEKMPESANRSALAKSLGLDFSNYKQASIKEDAPDDSIQVIGVGLPRTGTSSLKRALEILGFDPCHHMVVRLHKYRVHTQSIEPRLTKMKKK